MHCGAAIEEKIMHIDFIKLYRVREPDSSHILNERVSAAIYVVQEARLSHK